MNELTALEVDCANVAKMRADQAPHLLLDCREPDEFEHVHIEGSLLIPMSEIAGRVAELDPHRQQQIVVYCHHGGRSLRVAKWLRQQGFLYCRSMAGGIDEWAVSIDPNLPRY